MFVSSYSTYITTDTNSKIQREKASLRDDKNSAFSSKLSEKTVPNLVANKNLPVNYISNYKALNNQQKLLQEDHTNQAKKKFSKINAITSAKINYSDNTKIFSLLLKPSATLDQTPKTDKRMPLDIQEIQEKNLRTTMLNTYAANDNYYKVTAA